MTDFKKLDESIRALKQWPIPDGPAKDLKQQTQQQLQEASSDSVPMHGYVTQGFTWAKIAVAAVLILGFGFWSGRISRSRSLDHRQLAVLETSLRATLEPVMETYVTEQIAQEWNNASRAAVQYIQQQIDQRLSQDINKMALQILTASQTATNQAVQQLADAMRVQHIRQQARFAYALHHVETDRLQKEKILNTNLIRVEDMQQNHLRLTENLVTLVAHEQKKTIDPNVITIPNP